MVAAPPRQRLWTRAEYEPLIGLEFFAGQRVERIEGEIIEMGPMLGPHATALGLLQDTLAPHVGSGRILRPQMPLALGHDPAGRDSDPEPDLALVAGEWRDYVVAHPTTALLVVEIADSSLVHDRTRKAGTYARARIADYWIVNLVDRQVEVYRTPVTDEAARFGWRYADQQTLAVGQHLQPLAAPTAAVAVADLLP